MSHTLWCDIDDTTTNQMPGVPGHSFSMSDPDRQHFTNTRTVQVNTGNSYGRSTFQEREEVTTELDICGYHFRKQNPFQAPKVIESTIDEAIAEAEADSQVSETEMWRSKYLAEKARHDQW